MKKIKKLYQATIDLRTPREKNLNKEWIKMGIIPKYNYFTILYRTILIVSLSIILFNSLKTNAYNITGKEVPSFLYDNLKIECEIQPTRDVKHCIRVGLSIAYAESTWGHGKISYNYFGLTSYDKSIKSWVTRYNKYWYKAKNGFFFYGDRGILGPSHYCTDEISSKSSLGCPNGRKNFNFIFYKF